LKEKMFNESFWGWVRERALARLSIPAMAITILILVSMVSAKQETIIIVPPTLDEDGVTLTGGVGADTWHRSWGLFFAQTFGNITPGNIDFITRMMAQYLDPNVYNRIKTGLFEQVQTIRDENISISFSPEVVIYEPDTHHVYVSGHKKIMGITGDERMVRITYEFVLQVRMGSPVVIEYMMYEGRPVTKEVKATKQKG
jgi:conjugal transfer pilus assembly protein TraE